MDSTKPIGSDYKLRILVVEDDPLAVDILEAIIKSTAHTYQVAVTAEAAIEKLNNDPNFDVILLDYHLPGMNGREFVETIRNSETQKRNPNLWIIAHTAEQRVDQIEGLLAAGANDYLPKPIYPHMIVLKLLTGQYNVVRNRMTRRRLELLERMRAAGSLASPPAEPTPAVAATAGNA
jgi:CheY-like chemotaxis protein